MQKMANEKRLIDANALDEKCRRQMACVWNKIVAPASWAEAYEEFLGDIGDAPTVQAVEVVHGRWKAHKPDCRGYAVGFICSCCGHITYADYSMKECVYNYCPNCGAKMDGDGNG